jgi:hypothetical protein
MEDQFSIVQHLQDLHTSVYELTKLVKDGIKPEFSFRSSEIGELSTALAKAQAEYTIAGLNRQNPYFKSRYADLASVVQAARPALTKYGLSVVQNIVAHEDGSSVLHTILFHTSGQYIESRMKILPSKTDIQSISSYTTYIKRMSYASLVGVVTGDEDDDGEQAVATERATYAKGVATNVDYKPQNNEYITVSKDQLDELERELEGFPHICELVLDGLKIQSLADMPKNRYPSAITKIRQLVLEAKTRKS